MNQGMVMLCMTNVFIKLTQNSRKTTFFINNALGTMFMQLSIIVKPKKYINLITVCLWLLLPWYPTHATKNVVQTFTLYCDFNGKEKEYKARATIWWEYA